MTHFYIQSLCLEFCFFPMCHVAGVVEKCLHMKTKRMMGDGDRKRTGLIDQRAFIRSRNVVFFFFYPVEEVELTSGPVSLRCDSVAHGGDVVYHTGAFTITGSVSAVFCLFVCFL